MRSKSTDTELHEYTAEMTDKECSQAGDIVLRDQVKLRGSVRSHRPGLQKCATALYNLSNYNLRADWKGHTVTQHVGSHVQGKVALVVRGP